MRRCHLFVSAVILGSVSLVLGGDDKKLSPGESATIPGSFQSWMMTGKHAGRFHSPVCEYGLHPMALVFARDPIESEAAFGDLLQKLDQSIAKHPGLDSGATALLLVDGGFRAAVESGGEEFGKKLAAAAVALDKLKERLELLKKSKELERVTLGLVNEDNLGAFKLDEKSAATVLICNEQKILARYDLPREKVTEQETGAIAAAFEKLLQGLDTPPRARKKK